MWNSTFWSSRCVYTGLTFKTTKYYSGLVSFLANQFEGMMHKFHVVMDFVL